MGGKTIKMWGLTIAGEPKEFAISSELFRASPDFKRVAFRSGEEFEVWDMENSRKLYTLPFEGQIMKPKI